jgi:hypothetical protein
MLGALGFVRTVGWGGTASRIAGAGGILWSCDERTESIEPVAEGLHLLPGGRNCFRRLASPILDRAREREPDSDHQCHSSQKEESGTDRRRNSSPLELTDHRRQQRGEDQSQGNRDEDHPTQMQHEPDRDRGDDRRGDRGGACLGH